MLQGPDGRGRTLVPLLVNSLLTGVFPWQRALPVTVLYCLSTHWANRVQDLVPSRGITTPWCRNLIVPLMSFPLPFEPGP